MKILFEDTKHGVLKVKPENLDDIWHLYNVIEKNDLVKAVTFRTEEKQDDISRAKKPKKIKVKLGVRVSDVDFHKFSNRLRIKGVIEEGPQDHGSYHTLNVDAEKKDAITIIKEKWEPHQIERLKEAVKESQRDIITFVSLDDDSAAIAILRQSGIQHIADIDSHRSGKMYQSENTEKEFFGEITSILEANRSEGTSIIVVGPGFTKNRFVKYLKEKKPGWSNLFTHGTSCGGLNGVQEAIKTGVVDKIVKRNRVVFETKLVEDFFNEIKKNGLVTYGFNQVETALLNGAVKTLLIADSTARLDKGLELLKLARETKSGFVIINTLHEAGEKLESLGGVAAFLRFKT